MWKTERLDQQPQEILIVEDDPGVRYLETLALRRHHFPVIVAGNGAEAVKLLKNHAGICAVVLDLVMPQGDGCAVINHVRDQMPGLPVLVLTALRPDQLTGVDRGVVKQVLFKPIDMEELISDVRTLCANGNGVGILSDSPQRDDGGELAVVSCPSCGEDIAFEGSGGLPVLGFFLEHSRRCRHSGH